MSDPYTLPNGTLKNKLGITDPDALAAAETDYATLREVTLVQSGAYSAQGFARLRAIHKHLFQDVYAWAGVSRIMDIGKYEFADEQGRYTAFTDFRQIHSEASRIFAKASKAHWFAGLSRPVFVGQVTEHFAEVNMLHAFREGNGRTQRAYIARVAHEAEQVLDFSGVSKERMTAVSVDAANSERTDRIASLRRLFDEITDPVRAVALAEAARFLAHVQEKMNIHWNEHDLYCAAPGEIITGQFIVAGEPNAIAVIHTHRGAAFVVVNAADLPDAGKGLAFQQAVSFVATRTPAQAAQYLFDEVERTSAPGARTRALSDAIRNLRDSQDAALIASVDSAYGRVMASVRKRDTDARRIQTELGR